MEFKIAVLYAVRGCMHIFWSFPVKKKKIMFCSFSGKSINCNPMYFNRYLEREAKGQYEYVWAVNEPEQVRLPEDLRGKIRLVRTGTFAYFKELMTAGIFLYNVGIPKGSLVPKRRKQIWVNTWHGGGAFKAANLNADVSPLHEEIDRIIGKELDIFVSSNRIFTEKLSEVMRVNQQNFCPSGLPRNDLFFQDFSACKEKVHAYFGIPQETKLLLFAPTFRGNFLKAKDAAALDYEKTVQALEERFGGRFAVLERKHPSVKATVSEGVYPASDYPDMQELLAAADVLITDYSSSIWDFSLMDKPGFLYFPDLADFSEDKDFYVPVRQWPYPCAQSMEELCGMIRAWEKTTALQKRDAYMRLTDCYEKGTASEQLLRRIREKQDSF